MLVRFGNQAPLRDGEAVELDAPTVTTVNFLREDAGFTPGITVKEVTDHLADAITRRDGITSLEGHADLTSLIHPLNGTVRTMCATKPTWVWSDNPDLAEFLGQWYDCPVGIPGDVENTHHTEAGPPGVHPGDNLDMSSVIMNDGRDIWAKAMGGIAVGASGVSTTAPGSTTYTLDGKSAPGSTTAWNGQRVYAGSSAVAPVYGVIVSNTNATPPVLTVDRWYNVATPGGAAATTPVAGPWVISEQPAPAWFIGLSSGSTAAGSAPNTASPQNLAGASGTAEYTTASGGLLRQLPSSIAHSAAVNTYVLTATFTANGSDALPFTAGSYGVFTSMVVTDTTKTMEFYNTITAAALAASGDTLTLTVTVTGT